MPVVGTVRRVGGKGAFTAAGEAARTGPFFQETAGRGGASCHERGFSRSAVGAAIALHAVVRDDLERGTLPGHDRRTGL